MLYLSSHMHAYCRGPVPPKLTAGHYAAVYGDELWIFPGPRNHNMMRVYCCDLTRYRWTEREVRGDPPLLSESRRNLDCFLDGKRLIVFGKIPAQGSRRVQDLHFQAFHAALPLHPKQCSIKTSCHCAAQQLETAVVAVMVICCYFLAQTA